MNTEFTGKILLRHVRLNTGGYEYGKFGKYHGVGHRFYKWESEDDEFCGELFADTREIARENLLKDFPNAKIRV